VGPGYFIIAILGCADGAAQCTPVATLPQHYASASECAQQTGLALAENGSFDFPTLLAECRAQDARSAATARPVKASPAGLRRS